MADDDEGQDEAPAPAPFGGKAAPLFKKKGAGKKFFDDHRLAIISVVLGVVGLWFVLRNRSSSTAGSTSPNVSGQSAPASNTPGGLTSSDPASMQPWWNDSGAGGGGGGVIPDSAAAAGSTPPAKHASSPASKGAAKPQPSSHPASSPRKSAPAEPTIHAVPAPASLNRAGTLAGMYAPLPRSSSPVHSVTPSAHPASHVAVGTSRNGSSVLVPFTYRAGSPAPMNLTSPAGHIAAHAKRPAGRRAVGHR